jgi:AcrR family transcriptional regulator
VRRILPGLDQREYDPVVATTDRSTEGSSRSERARSAILRATADLLDEVGFAAMTIEEVAARAGAGKTTIYRRWASKGALAMDAIVAEIGAPGPFPDTGSVVEDFRVQLRSAARVFNRRRVRHMLIGVIYEAQNDQELRDAFLLRYVNPRRARARNALTRGIARGELRPDFDEELFFDQILGALYVRVLVTGSKLNRQFTDQLVDQVFEGLRPPPKPR